ncbi:MULTISPECIES: N(5)-(carboxyethyl)ornithine synthase [Bacillus cereus group]|uniref:N(5)-(Carboxyethyl)ornithine synthase n=1 Tax=Bacillus cereus TaxID=1396 RepID=A0A2A9A4R0_BACCE|nr:MULTISPECIES: N(5)-(carboxyethyl)ornithine synthase [Bacillus cereus group]MBE7097079.1 N(5)-(carboxyethyl)ornithine synthase [Bacillus cereus]MDR4939554.1 N(5)-(carboxyethyl)ornithine synthase [Bacillus wiedmannii]PFE16662.1 N(5)-(carboxyethyl)ornithine synthase [Bacillus cereus]
MKKTIGFPISDKKNEKRRALVPEDIGNIKNKDMIYVEKGYGEILGITDQQYSDMGVNVVERDIVMSRDVICDPKAGDAGYLGDLNEGQLIFGWIHAVQNKDITNQFINNKLSAIAWEDMFEGGRHVFWRNNEIAGEAAILHAYNLYGKLPYETKVAILGRGNIGRGAYKTLVALGADVVMYDRRTEALFQKELEKYDVLVNAILWDVDRTDHIIYKDDLTRMKKGAMIIDISCDAHKAVETSIPTSIDNPVYEIDGILHYVVDHTPAMFYKTVSRSLSLEICKYIDFIVEDIENEVLLRALIIEKGLIRDKRIVDFQNRCLETV